MLIETLCFSVYPPISVCSSNNENHSFHGLGVAVLSRLDPLGMELEAFAVAVVRKILLPDRSDNFYATGCNPARGNMLHNRVS